jgi:CheY-like chemotaxis protein
VPDVRANAGQIHQILVNLLANAAQAIHAPRGRITIGLGACGAEERVTGPDGADDASGFAVISVSDDGVGMPDDVRSRIFEPFFTTKASGQGSGLGLAVVRGIVAAHGGSISVESEPGHGSTFRVRLPAADSVADATVQPQRGLSRGDERVLLVDDDDAVVRATRDLLESLGYRVSAFTQAGTALAQFRSDPDSFDVVVTDNLMPGMTGRELAHEVRRLDPEIPIVLISGYVDDDAEGDPAISVAMMKPASGQELSRVIQRAMTLGTAA